MCTTSIAMDEINRRLDTPSGFYQGLSPSAISEIDLEQQSSSNQISLEKDSKNPAKLSEDDAPIESESPRDPSSVAASGDDSLPAADGWSDSPTGSLGCINADVAPALPASSTPRKRRWSDVTETCKDDATPSKRVLLGDDGLQGPKPVSPDSQEAQQAQSCCESFTGSSMGQSADATGNYDDDDGYYSPALDLDCSAKHYSRRTLYIEYWSRTDECKERKWDHLDEIAEKYGSAEEHIFATTLNGRTACLEPNMFPYDTPAGIEHWTLWHVQDLNHDQVKQYVENWIDANAPHVHRWNYDDNPERSIDIFHVHVYFQVGEGDSVLQGRKIEELMHECD